MTVTPKLRLRRVGAVQVPLPVYQTAGSAGLDLCAALAEAVQIAPASDA